ncbi:4-galactosyl-N-acetylglucosaminide 3-alpha-L-fucosyltransferase 9 [Danio rerio]|uniref:Fucosyltransferase n=1 Tax=Danio rerio TaxID=7955 RepID=A0A8M1RRN0_DANRE|nr:alpha-(1,3)-fucosyltransferase 9-like [Danio rerio]|eukprot:XP_002665488.1 alpha-(1,3)-fucosyltransferase 9-like [Danio rerio]
MEQNSSSSSHRALQKLLAALVLLTCFSAIFYVYYKPTESANWQKCPAVPPHAVCRDTCISALQKPNQTHIINNTCTVNLTSVSSHFTQASTTPHTVILIWTWPFGAKFDLDSCSSMFDIHSCHLTDDRGYFQEADGVFFHHRDIDADLSNIPNQPRPRLQKWIWMNMESPSNSPRYSSLDDLFNLTSSYRLDSDISVPYGRLISGKTSGSIPKKTKLVCWIVSNWNSTYKRSQYYQELKKHINIDVYGNAFSKRISSEDYTSVVSSCRFYLSFENSVHKDYITEKLFNPLILGTVPVVLGPPRRNYEEQIPAGAFIHIEDFSGPEGLAEHLKLLEKNEDLYMQYFSWREEFVASESSFGLEHACRACDHVRRHRNYRVVNELNGWYWG